MYFALAITYLLELYLDYAAKKQYGQGMLTNLERQILREVLFHAAMA